MPDGIKLSDVISVASMISIFVVGWWANYANRNRAPYQNFTDQNQALKILNENIALASKRALDAEQHSVLVEEMAEKRSQEADKRIAEAEAREANTAIKLKALEERFTKNEKRRYHIGFDVILSENPEMLDSDITHYVEKRVGQRQFDGTEKRR